MAMSKRNLADELKQTRPFASLAAEAPVAILRTAHLLRRRMEAIVSVHDITLQQYNVLRILRGARGPLPTMEIAERMIEPSCGITRLVTTLEDKGLVRREQWTGDRRQFLCQITPAGLRTVDSLDGDMAASEATMTATVSSDQLSVLIEALAAIREATDDADH